jgi:hypothetical protein
LLSKTIARANVLFGRIQKVIEDKLVETCTPGFFERT